MIDVLKPEIDLLRDDPGSISLEDENVRAILAKDAELGLSDLFHFDKYILGYKEMEENPHQELCDFVLNKNPEFKKRFKMIELPRGSFKSTVVTVGMSCHNIVLDPNIRILIASEKLSNAQKFLSEIKGHIEGNDYYRMLYGKLDEKKNDSTWNQTEITISTRTKNMKEPTISTAGVDVTKVGMHYDLIIVDDPVSQSNVTSKEQMDKVLDWWKLLLSLLEPTGRMVVIGTRWDDGDLYGTLAEEPYKELFDFLVREAEWVEGNETKLYFPTRLTRDFLDQQKRIQGTYIYSCQYLNNPVSRLNQVFKEEWFKYFTENDAKNIDMNRFMACDPAISMEDGRDSTTFVIGGLDVNNNLYTLLLDKGKYTPNEICDKFIDYATRYKTLDNGLETIAFQKSLRYILNDKMRETGKFVKITELKTHAKDSKEMRISALQPRYEMGTIFHKRTDSLTTDLEYELLRFPKAKHDDLSDCLASILEIMYQPSSKVKKSHHKKNKKFRSQSTKW